MPGKIVLDRIVQVMVFMMKIYKITQRFAKLQVT